MRGPRDAFGTLFLAALCLSLAAAGTLPRPAPPLGVLLFTVDCLRADHLGCYGYGRPTSPNIDAWAARSALFSRVQAQGSWTSPGLMSLLTGLNPPAHGVVARDAALSGGADSLPALFRRSGFQVPNVCYLTAEPSFAGLGYRPPESDLRGDGVEGLRETLRRVAGGRFFLWFHYRDLHLPYRPADRYLRLFSDPDRWSEEKRDRLRAVRNRAVLPRGTARITEEDGPELEALYDAGVRQMDDRFGEVLQTLRDLGLEKSTLVVLSADHGEELMDHGWVGHSSTAWKPSLHEEVLRVPLILGGEAWIREPVRAPELVRQIDVLPTVADLLGLDLRGPVEGRSLAPLLRGEALPEAWAYSETTASGYRTGSVEAPLRFQSLRDGRWKLVLGPGPSGRHLSLHDLETDPREEVNLASREPAILERMQRSLSFTVARSQALYTLPEAPTRVAWAGPPPALLAPPAGARLRYGDHGGTLEVSLDGPADLPYQADYDVGTGAFRMEGRLNFRGNRVRFGPFPMETWDTLAQWNPWRIRVRPAGEGNPWSPWREFVVEPIAGRADGSEG